MEQFLFDVPDAAESPAVRAAMPLAARMRPRSLDEYAGQRHLLAPGKLLYRAITADQFSSIILSGPPGTGKTSLAELIARFSDSAFVRLSGVTSSVADVRKAIADAVSLLQSTKKRTVLFIDEIHRFNKAQQDSLLPDVEAGRIRLIGATTANPQFYVIGALLSRSLVFRLQPLSEEDIASLLRRAVSDERGFPDKKVDLADEAVTFLAQASEGDARRALSALELAVLTTVPDPEGVTHVTHAEVEESIQQKFLDYGNDGHYDTASAFIKSMRGSDADAAVYYLGKMLEAGEDIRFIARRIVILAAEDIGNADPRALILATSAMQAVEMIGMPEARILLAQAVTYCATAPKSNAAYLAVDAAISDIRNNRVQPIPVPLLDPNSGRGKAEGRQEEYKYPHDFGGFTVQDYLSVPKRYYEPKEIGYEAKIKERIDYFDRCRAAAKGGAAC